VDADRYDRLRRRVLWSLPSGLYLVGSRAGDQANLMTANWASQVATDPKLVGVGVQIGALTHRLITEGGVFSLCILARKDQAVVRRFVKPAAWDPAASTLNGFAVTTGRTGAPILGSAVAWVDCEVRHPLACGSHTWFVGEVVDCGASPDEGADILRMEDTRMSYGG
jgi:flavin reductase (DIM6/NTAB) family NADH-FMN oxidoreductase RutF